MLNSNLKFDIKPTISLSVFKTKLTCLWACQATFGILTENVAASVYLPHYIRPSNKPSIKQSFQTVKWLKRYDLGTLNLSDYFIVNKIDN